MCYPVITCIGGVWGGALPPQCPPKSEPIDFVRSINTKIFSHCLILFALSYFNEYVKAKLFIINVKKKKISVMRRIRNWLRSAMSQDRFSDLSILHIENDLTANLSGEKIVDTYANRKRGGFFYIR